MSFRGAESFLSCIVLTGWFSFPDSPLFYCSTPARAWVTKATFRDLLSPRVQWAIPRRLSRAPSITNLISLTGTERANRLHLERNGLKARRLQQYEVHNDEKNQKYKLWSRIKIHDDKRKTSFTEDFPSPPPRPFIAIKEILVEFSFLPALACAPLWLL